MHEEGKPEPRGLQLWVDLPKQFKMVEPSYQELGLAGFVLHLVIILFLLIIFCDTVSRVLIQRTLKEGLKSK